MRDPASFGPTHVLAVALSRIPNTRLVFHDDFIPGDCHPVWPDGSWLGHLTHGTCRAAPSLPIDAISQLVQNRDSGPIFPNQVQPGFQTDPSLISQPNQIRSRSTSFDTPHPFLQPTTLNRPFIFALFHGLSSFLSHLITRFVTLHRELFLLRT